MKAQNIQDWIEKIKTLCRPKGIHICDGSDQEFNELSSEMVKKGTLVALNPQKRPGSFWCASHPDDVARVEENTFICSSKKEDAGPTNNWKDPEEMMQHLMRLFDGCMEGRILYVVPYCMGPIDSPYSVCGVEFTDSPYVVLNMKIMTRMGSSVLKKIERDGFVPGVHSVGVPLKAAEKDVSWPCNPKNRWIVHFPGKKEIWSFGSGYGGNALLGKKCLALRIATVMGRDSGWLAEHMLILGITNPKGIKKYIAAAFPSACGKTNLAMLQSNQKGWKIECVGDDIAWIRIDAAGKMKAINPEAGFFGVAPGTSMQTNPNAMITLRKNAIFTNVALTEDKDIWWEGIGVTLPKNLTSWLKEVYDPASNKPAAHPNSRFTVSAKQCPIYDKEAENPNGVPISAILFGGRRNSVIPLVVESKSWEQGVLYGATLSSETTAAAKGEIGKLRHDPFAMLPFCGYHMGDYFSHWLEMGKKTKHPPKIFLVNWFRKSRDGKFLWPGFGENLKVLEWVFDRCEDSKEAQETPIGFLPKDFPADPELFKINQEEWFLELDEMEKYFSIFSPKMPSDLLQEIEKIRCAFHL